jgi:inorganic triphosphatase YgiF
MTSQTEIEIKLEMAPAARDGVLAALGTEGLQRTRLQAVYVDTPGRLLARHRIALRLRREGPRWVQTLKAAGAHEMARLEHNVDLGEGDAEPAIDPQRHAGTPAGERLFAVLGDEVLAARYRTDIERRHREIVAGGARIELAFDEGHIAAGDARWPVCELELELLAGEPADLVAEAGRWIDRHGLWLDVRSKAERGERLASGQRQVPARRAGRLSLPRDLSAGGALRTVIAHCLQQVQANAAEVADGRYDDEHVHQLRVGLRRLRTALRFFGAGQPEVDPAWTEALAELFRRLGSARDRAALAEAFEAPLQAAGAPLAALPPAEGEAPQALLREPSATRLWLALQAFALSPEPVLAQPARPLALRRLQRWHHRLETAARHPAVQDDAARHRLRKRAKRLRYAAEFCAEWLRPRRLRRYLRRLAAVQAALGDCNDIATALPLYRDLAAHNPRAWFAVGWLTARQDHAVAAADAALHRLAATRTPWQDGDD